MPLTGEERRKHIRIFLPDGQVRLVSDVLAVRVGRVIDISVGGVRFACETELDVKNGLDIEVTLPTGQRFRCLAEVRHAERVRNKSNEFEYGVEFRDLGMQELKELGDFIAKRLKKE